jgi:hypothetical protein
VANAIVGSHYHKHKGIRIFEMGDDFVFFWYTSPSPYYILFYEFNASLIWLVATCLGWPWAPAFVFLDFSSMFPYVGFMWDIDKKIVSLSDKKQAKYLTCLPT